MLRAFARLSISAPQRLLTPLSQTCLSVAPSFTQIRYASSMFRTRVASTRKGKKLRAKNHKGALSRSVFYFIPLFNKIYSFLRWLPLPDGNFVRKKGSTKANGKHVRSWKRKKISRLILANPQQKRLLKKLIPYWRKTRRSYGGRDVYREFKHLVQ